MAALADFNKPFGWNDPDNILGPHGTVGRVTEGQARAQMVLWSLAPTQLILGEDITKASPEYIATGSLSCTFGFSNSNLTLHTLIHTHTFHNRTLAQLM